MHNTNEQLMLYSSPSPPVDFRSMIAVMDPGSHLPTSQQPAVVLYQNLVNTAVIA